LLLLFDIVSITFDDVHVAQKYNPAKNMTIINIKLYIYILDCDKIVHAHMNLFMVFYFLRLNYTE